MKRKELIKDIELLEDSIKVNETKINRLLLDTKEDKDKLNSLNQRLEHFDKTPSITDHALLRFIDRILEIDVETIRNNLLERAKPAIELGANSLSLEEHGITFKIQNKAVTTIIKKA